MSPLSIVYRSEYGPKVQLPQTSDNHEFIRDLMQSHPEQRLPLLFEALVDSGWSELMLAELHMQPGSAWYQLLKSGQPRPNTEAIPDPVRHFVDLRMSLDAAQDPWLWLGAQTLKTRGWTGTLIGHALDVSNATVSRLLNSDAAAVETCTP